MNYADTFSFRLAT